MQDDEKHWLRQRETPVFRVGTSIEGEDKSKLGLYNARIIFSEKAIIAGVESLVNYTTK